MYLVAFVVVGVSIFSWHYNLCTLFVWWPSRLYEYIVHVLSHECAPFMNDVFFFIEEKETNDLQIDHKNTPSLVAWMIHNNMCIFVDMMSWKTDQEVHSMHQQNLWEIQMNQSRNIEQTWTTQFDKYRTTHHNIFYV